MEATHIASNSRSGKLGTLNEDDDDNFQLMQAIFKKIKIRNVLSHISLRYSSTQQKRSESLWLYIVHNSGGIMAIAKGLHRKCHLTVIDFKP